jgi:hypothetical protein
MLLPPGRLIRRHEREERYQRITYGFTVAAARVLDGINSGATNPKMTFIYVSGSGTDSSERGGSMWAPI